MTNRTWLYTILGSVLGVIFTYGLAGKASPTGIVESVILPLHDRYIQNYPPMTQRPLATCYAHTSAQLLELYLAQHASLPTDGEISPIWLATAHKWFRSNNTFRYGIKRSKIEDSRIDWAIRDALRDGFCPKSAVNQALSPFLKFAPQLYQEEIIDIMQSTFDEVKKGKNFYAVFSGSKGTAWWIDWIAGSEEKNRIFSEAENEEIKSSGAGFVGDEQTKKQVARATSIFTKNYKTTLEAIRQHEMNSHAQSFLEYLSQDLLAQCDKVKFHATEKPEIRRFGAGYMGPRGILGEIDSLIDAKNPRYTAIGYCSAYAEGTSEVTKRGFLNRLLPRVARHAGEEDCFPHYTMVMGKRIYADGKMDLLLMNTISPRDDIGDAEKGCLCRNDKTHKFFECTATPLYGSGNSLHSCWYDAEAVTRHVFEGIYLD